jgi:hypothetical protein
MSKETLDLGCFLGNSLLNRSLAHRSKGEHFMQQAASLSGVLPAVRAGRRKSRSPFHCVKVSVTLFMVVAAGAFNSVWGQSLNWEGQDGIFITPVAYAVSSNDQNFGRPVVAYHYFDGGDVVGGFHQVSVTMGALNRIEFGYTRTLHREGNTAGISPLWSEGFNTFHAKANLITERRSWRPALAVGFVARTQVQNVGGVILGKDTHNADFYAVVTKTVTQIRNLPLVFNVGIKATNASLLGLAGNAPGYQGRAFGAFAFAIRGPGTTTILLGSEVQQEPRHIEGLPTAVIPTTITYVVRFMPAGALPLRGWGSEDPKITLDFGIAQAAGNILPGVDLRIRKQFALGITYGF